MKKKEKPKQEKQPVKSKTKKRSKFFTYLIIALVIAFVYFFLKDPLISFLQTIPWLWGFILHVSEQITERTYLGLWYLAFFGGIFFIILPVEATFLIYIASGREFYFVIPIVIIGYVLGLCFDYFVGFALGKWVAKKMLKEKFDEKQEKMKKTGGIVLFFSNLFPMPIPWISLLYGAMRYKFKHFLIICLVGQALKFNLLFLGIEFLKPHFEQLWDVIRTTFSNFYDILKSLVNLK